MDAEHICQGECDKATLEFKLQLVLRVRTPTGRGSDRIIYHFSFDILSLAALVTFAKRGELCRPFKCQISNGNDPVATARGSDTLQPKG
jgi:hypothetical protein